MMIDMRNKFIEQNIEDISTPLSNYICFIIKADTKTIIRYVNKIETLD
jgi:hypothetical protein